MTNQDARERTAENLLKLCLYSDPIFKLLKDADDGATVAEIAARLNAPTSVIHKTLQKMIVVEAVDFKRRGGKTKHYFLTHAAQRMRSINALATFRPWIYRPIGASNEDSGIYQ